MKLCLSILFKINLSLHGRNAEETDRKNKEQHEIDQRKIQTCATVIRINELDDLVLCVQYRS
jgi:hypothetical protein